MLRPGGRGHQGSSGGIGGRFLASPLRGEWAGCTECRMTRPLQVWSVVGQLLGPSLHRGWDSAVTSSRLWAVRAQPRLSGEVLHSFQLESGPCPHGALCPPVCCLPCHQCTPAARSELKSTQLLSSSPSYHPATTPGPGGLGPAVLLLALLSHSRPPPPTCLQSPSATSQPSSAPQASVPSSCSGSLPAPR